MAASYTTGRDTTLWAVTADAARAQSVLVPRAEIRALAARIRRGVKPAPDGAASLPFDRQASVALYQRLIELIADLLAHRTTVIYVPETSSNRFRCKCWPMPMASG